MRPGQGCAGRREESPPRGPCQRGEHRGTWSEAGCEGRWVCGGDPAGPGLRPALPSLAAAPSCALSRLRAAGSAARHACHLPQPVLRRRPLPASPATTAPGSANAPVPAWPLLTATAGDGRCATASPGERGGLQPQPRCSPATQAAAMQPGWRHTLRRPLGCLSHPDSPPPINL